MQFIIAAAIIPVQAVAFLLLSLYLENIEKPESTLKRAQSATGRRVFFMIFFMQKFYK